MPLTLEGLLEARILIVDDQEHCALGLTRLLERAGYKNCLAITDPTAVLENVLDCPPDLIFLDLHMEPLSGVEVLKLIGNAIEPIQRPLIVVLTADTSCEVKREALRSGANEFLSKPVDADELLIRIRNVLQNRALFLQCQHYSQDLETLVAERTAELKGTLAELHDTERQVVHQARIRALGTMASGVVHDMNNSLMMILGYGELLLSDSDECPHGSKCRHGIELIVKAAEDDAAMVQRLHEFYRPPSESEERQPLDLNALIDETIIFTTPKWRAQAELRGVKIGVVHEPSPLPLIGGSPAEIREVLTNLIFNAVDAMPHGGLIRIQTSHSSEWVRLEVSDTGTGMTEEARQRCMEPFFTTKGDRGTGLGLAVSHGIIRRHGGILKVLSKLNKGTTFQIELPLTTPVMPPHLPAVSSVGPLRVLVVDDHENVREILSAYLTGDQHRVEMAADAIEGLSKFRHGSFDLVITDRAMPGANGNALAAAVKRLNPHQPIIMLTGFADLADDSGGNGKEPADVMLTKPVRLQDLRAAIAGIVPANQAEKVIS